MRLIDNPLFAKHYRLLEMVKLNPRRHTAPNALAHSEAVAALAVRLARENGLTAAETDLLETLGCAHDIGKVKGTARPRRSLDVLDEIGVTDRTHLALRRLVRAHDVSLPWFNALRRGKPPEDDDWRTLALDVDLRLLCIFMVADRVDAPPGWRGNAPTMWFIEHARARGLIPELRLDLSDHPSSISAGGVLVRQGDAGPEALLIRVRERSFELPKGRIEWDELPGEAAVRECQEEAGIESRIRTGGVLSAFEYPFTKNNVTFLKRVVYFRLEAAGPLVLGPLPEGTREILWVTRESLGSVPLRKGELRPVIETALD